jgi:acetyl-CoA acetyltransferase
MPSHEVVIVGGARTPMAEYVGAFKDLSAIELGARATAAALERAGAQPGWVDHVVMGNALQTSGDAIYGARHVALKAGVPWKSRPSPSTGCVDRGSSPWSPPPR